MVNDPYGMSAALRQRLGASSLGSSALGGVPIQDLLRGAAAGGNGGPYMDGDSLVSGDNGLKGDFTAGGYTARPYGPGLYQVFRPGSKNGDAYDIYDANGNFVSSHKFDFHDSAVGNFLDKAIPIAAATAIGATGLGFGPLAGLGEAGAALAPELASAAAYPGATGGLLGGAGAGAGGLTAAELEAAALTGGSTLTGDAALAAYAGLPGVTPEAMAAAMGMTPEAFASLGAGGLGAAGAAAGMTAGTGAAGGGLSSLLPAGVSSILGPAATLGGALLGSQGQKNEQSATRDLPGFLQQPVANDLIPRTMGLLNTQMPQAQAAGQQLMQAGGGLLGQPVAGNGYGKVTLNAPTTPTNPYLAGMADDIQHRTNETLGQSFNAIRGNAVGVGGLGGSRQGVAEGIATKGAADSLQGNLANLYGQAYNSDQNRALQQYGYDQNFYGNQRSQDLAGFNLGMSAIPQGLQTQWSPLTTAGSIYGQFSPFGTTTQSGQQGGGALGALGGGLGAAQIGKLAGWW